MSRNAQFAARSPLASKPEARQARPACPRRLLTALAAAAGTCLLLVSSATAPGQPANLMSPLEPQARIVAVQDPGATTAFEPHPEIVQAMVDRAITNLTGKATVSQAWLSLVRTQDVVGIKVYSAPGPDSGTRPAVVAAVVHGLLAAGLPPRNIVVWDRLASDLRSAGFFALSNSCGIRVESSTEAGWDEKVFYDQPFLGQLVWSDLEFGKTGPGIGRKSFVSKLVSRGITKIINVTPLLNHNVVGVCGNLYSLALGSVDNILRFESDANALAQAVPEIYAKEAIGDHVVLNITDALICQYEGGDRVRLHYSIALNELRFSTDPVALDVLSIQELERQREAAHAPAVKPSQRLYTFASLLDLGIADPKKIVLERMR